MYECLEWEREFNMWIASLLLALVAVYLPPFMAARGEGSRGLWNTLIPAGLLVATVFLMLWRLSGWPVEYVLFSPAESISFGQRSFFHLISMIIRISISLSLGSFLAALRFRKSGTVLPTPQSLGIGSTVGGSGR